MQVSLEQRKKRISVLAASKLPDSFCTALMFVDVLNLFACSAGIAYEMTFCHRLVLLPN
uniref:Uncharacterized protein n=1 Tax=Arundo donax TaxID=35708 RepID=A0A0A9F0K8_ARUDO